MLKDHLIPNSLDPLFQAVDCVYKGITPTHLARARELLQQALACDAANIDALVWLALVDSVSANLYPADRAARLAAAEANVTKALSVVPNHTVAHLCMGLIQIYTNRAGQGLAECERALQLDPNNASVHAHIGSAKISLGRAEETEAHVHEAFRLSPRDQFSYLWMHFIGMANIFLGRDGEAVTWLRRGIETNRNYSISRFYLAAALVHCGNLVEARGAIKAGRAIDPTFTIAHFRAGAFSDNPVYLAGRERLIEGMRKAGVPEG